MYRGYYLPGKNTIIFGTFTINNSCFCKLKVMFRGSVEQKAKSGKPKANGQSVLKNDE